MTVFTTEIIESTPLDPLFALKNRYTADERPYKVDLGIGAYRDNNGKPWILPAVRELEKLLQSQESFNHEYLGINGYPAFVKSAVKVILGDESTALTENRVSSVQSLSGTGALHLAATFLKHFYKKSDLVYFSAPTWGNHIGIFENVGFKSLQYPYWDAATKSLDLEGFLKLINDAPEGSIFVLHACAHNPTGLDPSKEEWIKILDAIKAKGHFPLFDSLYQGFTTGSLEEDAWALRKLVDEYKMATLICQSFAKNCGMYGERVGCVHVVVEQKNDQLLLDNIQSQLCKIMRSEVSTAPLYGAKIVATVLNTPELRAQWDKDLIVMSSRITAMRHLLRDQLVALGAPGSWDHIVTQKGMFSFTALSPEVVKRLESEHAVYLAANGRASIAGLNESNVSHVAKSIYECLQTVGKDSKF